MTERRLLISFAHPDDESFGLGGLIARYVAEGVKVYLICATNGDVGTIPPEMLNGYESAAALRLAELDCAAEILGFTQVFKFGYKDSGMMGSTTNADPESLWYQWQNNPEVITRQVAEVIREVKPQVVITFNKFGGYGHPDHIAIQRATLEAFDLAGDTSYVTGELNPYQPQKLYYNSIPVFVLRFGMMMLRLRGGDPRRAGTNQDIDLQAILDNADPTHTKIDVKPYLRIWMEANACHASQGGGRSFAIPGWLRNLVGAKQNLTRVYPVPVHNGVDEYDIFAGICQDELSTEME